jgi:hypothetical protein
MGVLLYFMWSGRLPFEGTSFVAVATQQITATPAPPSAHRSLPPQLERVILRCLEKDPARRPQSAQALREELDAALAEAMPGETLPPAGRIEPPAGVTRETGPELATAPRAARARPGRVALATAAVIVAALIVAAVLRFSGPADRVTAQPVVTAPPVAAPAPAAPPAPTAVPPGPAVTAPTPTARSIARRKPALAPAHPDPATPSAAEQRGFLRENPFR